MNARAQTNPCLHKHTHTHSHTHTHTHMFTNTHTHIRIHMRCLINAVRCLTTTLTLHFHSKALSLTFSSRHIVNETSYANFISRSMYLSLIRWHKRLRTHCVTHLFAHIHHACTLSRVTYVLNEI